MAEILYADGRTETVSPPAKKEEEIRAPSAFETYRSGRQRLTQSVLDRVPLPGFGAAAAEFLTPQTPAEQGVEGGLMLMGPAGKFAGKAVSPAYGAAARLIGRAGAPAAGGGVGSMIDKPREPLTAAWEGAKGAATGLAGDLLPFAKSLLGRRKVIGKADEKAIGGAIEQAVPSFGRITSKLDLDAIGKRRRGPQALETAKDEMLAAIERRLMAEPAPSTARHAYRLPQGVHQRMAPRTVMPGHSSIDVPSLAGLAGGGSMTFRDAVGWLGKLSDEGWLLSNQAAHGLDAKAARALRDKARGEIVKKLNGRAPGLGDSFDRGMNELAQGHLFVEILQKPGVISGGKLDMNALRDTMETMYSPGSTFSQRLERIAKPADVKRFYDALTRNSGDLTARDVTGKTGLGIHSWGGTPHLGLTTPRLPKYVGHTPPRTIGPGGTPISLGLSGIGRDENDGLTRAAEDLR